MRNDEMVIDPAVCFSEDPEIHRKRSNEVYGHNNVTFQSSSVDNPFLRRPMYIRQGRELVPTTAYGRNPDFGRKNTT